MSAISRVMVILDNDLEIRNQVVALLQRIGVQPIMIRDGGTAMALLDEKGLAPSLVILDLTLEDMDGLDVLRRIRKLPWLNTVPVLILSSKAEPEVIRRGLDSGADAYVMKAYLTHSLVDRVRVLLAAGRRALPQTKFYGRTAPLSLEKANGSSVSTQETSEDTEPSTD